MKWMELPEEYCGEGSKFVIVPLVYEKDLTFGQGASAGAAAIINASAHLEYYDEYFDAEPFEQGIKVLEPLNLMNCSAQEMVQAVNGCASILKDKFPLFIGGDHAVTIGTVKAMEQLEEDFSVIVFDAHADFRDSWNNSAFNHACVCKQLSKKHDVAIVGLRSLDVDEKRQLAETPDAHVIYAWEDVSAKLAEILPQLKPKVFLSIDVDAFDFIKNTGTPEPGGLGWYQTLELLRQIFSAKQVIGCDVVEFAPQGNNLAEAYALAKLMYKLMSLANKHSA